MFSNLSCYGLSVDCFPIFSSFCGSGECNKIIRVCISQFIAVHLSMHPFILSVRIFVMVRCKKELAVPIFFCIAFPAISNCVIIYFLLFSSCFIQFAIFLRTLKNNATLRSNYLLKTLLFQLGNAYQFNNQ